MLKIENVTFRRGFSLHIQYFVNVLPLDVHFFYRFKCYIAY